MNAPASDGDLLACSGLSVGIGSSPILRGVSFSVCKGEVCCLVGESGCGKSMTALALMGLLPRGAAIRSGSIRFGGTELTGLSEKALASFRGRRIAMIFQDPMTCLNPVFRIGDQIEEGLLQHGLANRREAREKADGLLREVGISPDRRSEYPHQLSGGMRQRVMIASAMSCDPELLIADEPTTALDVTIQEQILELLRDSVRSRGMGMLFITHDLAVVSEIADQVNVMYAGEIVESAPAEEFFRGARHPYSTGLMRCLPQPGDTGPLSVIPGRVAKASEYDGTCAFASRCPHRAEICLRPQELSEVSEGHFVRCCRAAESEI